MKIGVIGTAFVGKTTIFNLLTGTTEEEKVQPGETKLVKVKDPRVTRLSGMYKPKKTTYATLAFTDTYGLDAQAGAKERNRVFSMIQKVESLLWVIGNHDQAFKGALEQFEEIRTEIILHDLELVENRKTSLETAKKKLEKDEEKELEILKTLHAILENEDWPNRSDYTGEQLKLISSLGLFTLKPSIVLINSDEEQFTDSSPEKEKITDMAKQYNFGFIEICGKYEMEINELDEAEKREFLKELDINESGIDRLTRVVYEYVGLISFFTVGEDEVRAWTIEKGLNAKRAAGKIHSDLERGFIRADVMTYDDLAQYGSESALRNEGLYCTEGKDYIVKDGDIINIRFNV